MCINNAVAFLTNVSLHCFMIIIIIQAKSLKADLKLIHSSINFRDAVRY